ncbi:hypothetical protein HETIRDRAFT_447771 [Heterobasidion irregulare TC 32-1]|uniref:Uncharacterized protein n=1 Tax=Heterobasidion irregulare (strain TC 32-1) TaxID=747525 RepID=W4KN11_HETIT|nr:uncharacterized protein HETIRDRAFT_447771 [Heterobasidion irregulare TC 32-1]ETW87202.1 hypothetical protein HETIRDRAFT_447771 [Heterobasidion irregulare TC 32-1]
MGGKGSEGHAVTGGGREGEKGEGRREQGGSRREGAEGSSRRATLAWRAEQQSTPSVQNRRSGSSVSVSASQPTLPTPSLLAAALVLAPALALAPVAPTADSAADAPRPRPPPPTAVLDDARTGLARRSHPRDVTPTQIHLRSITPLFGPRQDPVTPLFSSPPVLSFPSFRSFRAPPTHTHAHVRSPIVPPPSARYACPPHPPSLHVHLARPSTPTRALSIQDLDLPYPRLLHHS